MRPIKLIPKDGSISWRSFCDSYYRLAETIIAFSEKARREGLLALEDELETLPEDIFKQGLRLVVDGTDAVIIRDVMTLKTEREHDYYRKKLMEIAMDSVLRIQDGDSPMKIIFSLAAMVDIKNNPLDAACTKYLAGDYDALDNIDFKAALQREEESPETEREEIRFIKRAMFLSEESRREGLLALDKHLDFDGITEKDVFEYGLPLAIDDWPIEEINKILSLLISHETNPARKNFALAKKDAIGMINAGYNPQVLLMTLCAYFDDSITKVFGDELAK
jgi:flagellar motor component MotA